MAFLLFPQRHLKALKGGRGTEGAGASREEGEKGGGKKRKRGREEERKRGACEYT
jgi:hypothetical protein